MGSSKTYKILTIVSHSIIIIGAGHGIGILLFIDFLCIPLIIEEGLRSHSGFQKNLYESGLLSVIGKIALIGSFFVKKDFIKLALEIFGVIILWVSFYALTSEWKNNLPQELSFLTGIPFLISLAVFLFSIVLKISKGKTQD